MHLKSSEDKIGMYFPLLLLVSNWQLSTHLSPHFLVSVWCRPGKSWPAAKPRSEIQLSTRDTDTSLSSHTKHHGAKQSNHVLKESLHQQSPSPEANAVGCKRNKTLEMSQAELRAKASAGSAVLLNTLCNFLTCGKKLTLQFI